MMRMTRKLRWRGNMSTTHTGTVTLLDGMPFGAASSSGHTPTLDASGWRPGAARGWEAVLLGLDGCTAMDVISILRKMRQQVTNDRVEVSGERAETHPQVYTQLTVEHVVTGRRLDEALMHRAIELSDTRYCSASAMLRQAAPITTRYHLVDADTGAETAAADLATTPA
jgi:putative redox protein